jgi:hypothetical protein
LNRLLRSIKAQASLHRHRPRFPFAHQPPAQQTLARLYKGTATIGISGLESLESTNEINGINPINVCETDNGHRSESDTGGVTIVIPVTTTELDGSMGKFSYLNRPLDRNVHPVPVHALLHPDMETEANVNMGMGLDRNGFEAKANATFDAERSGENGPVRTISL